MIDPLTIILAITTGTATIAAAYIYREGSRLHADLHFRKKLAAGDAQLLARQQAAIDDLEHQAFIRSEQLAIAQRQITEAYEELARYHQLREARRLADNAARKERHQRAKGVA